jgi:ABC-2 type transport system ATP-binding protein
MLEVKGVMKSYGGVEILHDIAFSLQKGEVTGLLGENGAGKSTLLQIIAGLERADSGEVLLQGRSLTASDQQRIGALIERPPLYGHLSAFDNLKVLALVRGIRNLRIEEVLQMVGLEDTRRKRAKFFSIGMRQRLGIGMALLPDPELLLLDEPTSGLDPVGVDQFIELIDRLQEQGTTVLLSSHNLLEIQALAPRVIMLQGGRIIFDGSSGDLRHLQSLFAPSCETRHDRHEDRLR